ncbi:hypothetical protein CKO28_22815 [Rhodovibrio sodomensis]|uniref:Tyr recombinase domain-containing protein n=1 Tax=Rhodovibrio sodomensis TaxID=1088 RepID=A0ABS1DLM4_9PROT|nr:site-specific integrase [Rhodovibrio sodomensis]MBK1670852.1 hypothetical protein [Rhodovibrio sodomensis]
MARPKRSSGYNTGGKGDGTPYLKVHPKTGIYQIWYYDASARGMRSRTTGTRDYREAERKRSALVAERDAEKHHQPIESARLAALINTYATHGAPKLASMDQALRACELILEYWGSATVADLTQTDTRENPPPLPKTQDKWIAWLRHDKGYSKDYIHRTCATLSRVLHFARENHVLIEAPYVKIPQGGNVRERWLLPHEVLALLGSAHALGYDHVGLFIKICLQTCARPEAIFDLTWQQCKMSRRRIALNPPGRAQNRKRRPNLPMTDALYRTLAEVRPHNPDPKSHVVLYQGRPIKEVKSALKTITARAERVLKAHAVECGEDPSEIELYKSVTPYVFRHTGATWMAQRGVSMRDLSEYLGHVDERMARRHYWHHHPDYMKQGRDAANESAVWEE